MTAVQPSPSLQNAEPVSLRETDRRLDPNQFNPSLLEWILVYLTNQVRESHHLTACHPDSKLKKAGRRHSREMVRLNYFSHRSPTPKNRYLIDRLKNTGLVLDNTTMGENLAVDYFLKIAGVPFYTNHANGKDQYIDSKTGKPIPYQTYREFASRTVQNWMESPNHRENILNRDFDRIGIGVAVGNYNNMQAIYVTQCFMGSINPVQHNDQQN